jgi:zinc D-Ala-D-Ala dipeptidase
MNIRYFAVFAFFLMSGCAQKSMLLIADPKIIKLSIVENNEPFIDLKNQKVIAFGTSPEIPNNTDYTKMRKSVYDKLIQAQSRLPAGLKFCLYESYRSLSLQEKLFNNRFTEVKNLHPDWSHTDLFNETIKLVSPVKNLDGSVNVPPHSTGGAIDIYLIDANMNPIDMGIHPKDWMDDVDGSTSETDSKKISQNAIKHRKIMNHVLENVGFVNYPYEYWHWSYGDRYWAYHKKQNRAIYGSVK